MNAGHEVPEVDLVLLRENSKEEVMSLDICSLVLVDCPLLHCLSVAPGIPLALSQCRASNFVSFDWQSERETKTRRKTPNNEAMQTAVQRNPTIAKSPREPKPVSAPVLFRDFAVSDRAWPPPDICFSPHEQSFHCGPAQKSSLPSCLTAAR